MLGWSLFSRQGAPGFHPCLKLFEPFGWLERPFFEELTVDSRYVSVASLEIEIRMDSRFVPVLLTPLLTNERFSALPFVYVREDKKAYASSIGPLSRGIGV